MEDSNENKVVVNTPEGRLEHMIAQYDLYAGSAGLDSGKRCLFKKYAGMLSALPAGYIFNEYVPSSNWFSFDMNLGGGILLNCTFEADGRERSNVYFSFDKDGEVDVIDWCDTGNIMGILDMYLKKYGIVYEK